MTQSRVTSSPMTAIPKRDATSLPLAAVRRGVAFVAADLMNPSQLWMRRMLDGLGDDVKVLIDTVDPGAQTASQYEFLSIESSAKAGPSWLRWCKHRWSQRAQVRRLISRLSRPDIDCVLVHYLTVGVRFRKVWQQIRKPVYVHCHGWDVTWDRRDVSGMNERTHHRNYVSRARSLPANVSFIANSQATKRRLEQIGISSDRVFVKYLGVPDRQLAKAKCRAGSATLNLLYLGRLIDFKGPDLTIRAFEMACDKGLDGHLVIAGDGPLRATCERLRSESRYADRIELRGAVSEDEGDRLRAAADVFTAHNQLGPASRQEEAFGVAYVEAMAAGLPVVSGRNGSIPEIISDGEHGLLFEPGDIEAQARAFLYLQASPKERQRMGERGRAKALREFSSEREIRQLRDILGLS